MDPFRVLYYPNSECRPLVLAKSILVFDEMVFFDHPSLSFKGVGTVGHDSRIRHIVPELQREGYHIDVIKPIDGPVEGELEKLIDVDLLNQEFRDTFFQLIRNDPTFLVNMIPNGNYGKQGDASQYRQTILNVPEKDVPRTTEEIRNFKAEDGINPEIWIALTMAADSYKFNFSTYLAIEQKMHLFGDSRGMDMLLKAKLKGSLSSANKKTSHDMAFTLLDHIIPNEAFRGKGLIDIVRFRNKMSKDRDKFKERILGLTVDLQDLNDRGNQKKFNEVLYKHLLPEARAYQHKMAENWDKFFKDSTKAVLSDQNHITQLVVTSLSISFAAALLAGALRIGVNILPHLIDYLKEKEALERRNPYTYLMKFS